jgi:C4-dicarboxylate-specific signal transduction histidine kinase
MNEARLSEPRYRILIVDDDDDVREALEDELEVTYDVTAVSTGTDAIGRLDEAHFDAIISDQRMPGMSGVQVLEAAVQRDAELVRILLTGFVDDDARQATMQDNAPYKIGKPWHDEVEVTLKRAFEHRDRERSLSGSVTDALALAGVDAEIASIETLAKLAKVLVRRCQSLQGVSSCEVQLRDETSIESLGGGPLIRSGDKRAWYLDLPITSDGSARLVAEGCGAVAKDIVDYLAGRALHWSSEDAATRLAKNAYASTEAQHRLQAVSRRATLGTMTAALVHELASMVQTLQGSLFELEDFVLDAAERKEDPDVIETLETAVETSSRMVALFRATRTFVRSGDAAHRPCAVKDLVERSIALCRGSLRTVASVEVSELPNVEVDVNEALFLQVLVNLLRNAAEASPPQGTISFEIRVAGEEVLFSVRDEGEGVPDDFLHELFEPFTTTKSDHGASGLGLAISSEIVAEAGGSITYEASESGGAVFQVKIPLMPRNSLLSVP